jgi:hypothetical protein
VKERNSEMSLKYEILRRAVKLAGLKKAGEKSAEEIITIKKKAEYLKSDSGTP